MTEKKGDPQGVIGQDIEVHFPYTSLRNFHASLTTTPYGEFYGTLAAGYMLSVISAFFGGNRKILSYLGPVQFQVQAKNSEGVYFTHFGIGIIMGMLPKDFSTQAFLFHPSILQEELQPIFEIALTYKVSILFSEADAQQYNLVFALGYENREELNLDEMIRVEHYNHKTEEDRKKIVERLDELRSAGEAENADDNPSGSGG